MFNVFQPAPYRLATSCPNLVKFFAQVYRSNTRQKKNQARQQTNSSVNELSRMTPIQSKHDETEDNMHESSTDTCSNLSDFVDFLLASDNSPYAVGFEGPKMLQELTSNNNSTAANARSCMHGHRTVSYDTAQSLIGASDQQNGDTHTLSRQVKRPITNCTYLRRLYLSLHAALCLFPTLSTDFPPITLSRRERVVLQPCKTKFDVILTTVDGQRWAVVLECAVSASGQLHCCLVNGWPQFCRDAGIRVGHNVVFRPTKSGSKELRVSIERQT